MMSETLIATVRVLTTISFVLTNEQKREAAKRLRELDGDESSRQMFAKIAAALEDAAAD